MGFSYIILRDSSKEIYLQNLKKGLFQLKKQKTKFQLLEQESSRPKKDCDTTFDPSINRRVARLFSYNEQQVIRQRVLHCHERQCSFLFYHVDIRVCARLISSCLSLFRGPSLDWSVSLKLLCLSIFNFNLNKQMNREREREKETNESPQQSQWQVQVNSLLWLELHSCHL